MAPLKPLDFIMALRSLPAGNALLTASVVLAFCLITASGHTQGASPFAKLEGQWAGSGTIDLANGAYDPIKCRASYDVLEEQNNLQLSIRCASDSYNFDMHASATLASKAISGSDVVADGAAFSADLAMVTRGDRQSVVIKSKEVNATVKGATVTLQRS